MHPSQKVFSFKFQYTPSLIGRRSRRSYDGPRHLIHHCCNIRREAIFSLASTHLERFVAIFEHQQVVLAYPTHIEGSPGNDDSSFTRRSRVLTHSRLVLAVLRPSCCVLQFERTLSLGTHSLQYGREH